MNWEIHSRRWMTATDAISGNRLTFNVDHISAIRQNRQHTTSVVLSNGMEYEVEGEHESILAVMGIHTEKP